METKLNLNPAPPAPTATPATGQAPARSEASVMQNDPADLRLVIEPAPGVGGGYIYKTVDRRTGTVVLELPREQVAQLPDASGYTAGALVRAKA